MRQNTSAASQFSLAPEIKLGLYAWAFVFIAPWLRLPSFGIPYGLTESVVCAFLVACFIIPASCQPNVAFDRHRLQLKNWVVIFLTLLSFAAFFSFYRMSGATGDLTLSELRNSHIAGEVAIDSGFSRIFSLICPAVAFILFETTRRSLNPRWLAFTFFLLGSMLLVSVSSFGARYDVLCGVCFTLTIFVAHYSAFISRIPKSAAVFAVVISFIILAFVNARFAAVRSTEGLGEDAMDVFYETGVEITRTIGFKKSNYTIALTIGMVDEYLLHTIERFGMYLEKDRLEPAWGQHSFSLLTRRIGFNDGPRFKQAVDELYYPFGIENNIWATAFREFCIDFKLLGTIAFCAALGILYRLCQTKFFYSWFANFLAAYIATIFLLAPVSSIFKSLYFQAAFLSAVLLLAIDVMFGNVVTAWICERSEIEYDKLDEH